MHDSTRASAAAKTAPPSCPAAVSANREVCTAAVPSLDTAPPLPWAAVVFTNADEATRADAPAWTAPPSRAAAVLWKLLPVTFARTDAKMAPPRPEEEVEEKAVESACTSAAAIAPPS